MKVQFNGWNIHKHKHGGIFSHINIGDGEGGKQGNQSTYCLSVPIYSEKKAMEMVQCKMESQLEVSGSTVRTAIFGGSGTWRGRERDHGGKSCHTFERTSTVECLHYMVAILIRCHRGGNAARDLQSQVLT